MSFFAGISASFLIAVPALFSIVNPLGGALIYSQVTSERSHAERVALAWRIASYSTAVMLVSLWAGAALMSFFGISIEALRVAGGLVVAAQAWAMLSAPDAHADRKQEQASPAQFRGDIAFFPMTIPFTTGPGTISVAIALSASRPGEVFMDRIPFFAGASLAALAVALSVGFSYAAADRVVALLGEARARVLTRLAAFLLLCIGMQILLTGVEGVLKGIR